MILCSRIEGHNLLQRMQISTQISSHSCYSSSDDITKSVTFFILSLQNELQSRLKNVKAFCECSYFHFLIKLEDA
ncbi:unnamed protein product [Lactuca saligna]|uniref:Uncharacterized protein n=1 Tax=Lactuca saligna TaxID=75948 RepID=A0AA36E6K3_LACSI|nr:unnamed protein product [Lactuca saligna]